MKKAELDFLKACAVGDIGELLESIQNGANFNVKDDRGFTGLHFAVYNNKLEVLEILIQVGVDPNVVDLSTYVGFTVLHFASAFGSLELVQTLLKFNNIHHIQNHQGKKPSEIASTIEKRSLLEEDEKSKPSYFNLENNETNNETNIEIPNNHETQPKICRNFCFFKKIQRIGRIIALIMMMGLPYLYFIFTPLSYPWFMIPCGIILGLFVNKKIKQNREYLEDKKMFCMTRNLAAFIITNSILVISNFYFGGMPWSLMIVSFWGMILLIKAIKIFHPVSKYNTPLFRHYLVYSTFGFCSFIFYCYFDCSEYYCYRNTYLGIFGLGLPMGIWTAILLLHYIIVNGVKREYSFCGIKISRDENNEIHREEEFEIIEKEEAMENGMDHENSKEKFILSEELNH
jgi:hypothetical protein